MKEIYEAILNLKAKGGKGVLVTVVEKEGHGPATLGTKMLVTADGKRLGTVGGGAIEYAALNRISQLLKEGQNGTVKYLLNPDNELLEGEKTGMMCGGSTTLFYEIIGFAANLYIFGAGHIGQTITRFMKNMDYYITVIDNREGLTDQIEHAGQRLTIDSYETALQPETVPPDSFFLIATHSHALDYVVLKRIYSANWQPRYVGLVASRKKSPQMIARLKEEVNQDINLNTLYTPVGLDIGGATPDEIAISIIAELQAVRFNKEGHKHLRNKEKA